MELLDEIVKEIERLEIDEERIFLDDPAGYRFVDPSAITVFSENGDNHPSSSIVNAGV